MLFRSTGLGKTQLTAVPAELERANDYIVLHIDTLEPVQWRIKVAMNFRDMMTVFAACVKISIMGFILSPKQWFNKEPKSPGEF